MTRWGGAEKEAERGMRKDEGTRVLTLATSLRLRLFPPNMRLFFLLVFFLLSLSLSRLSFVATTLCLFLFYAFSSIVLIVFCSFVIHLKTHLFPSPVDLSPSCFPPASLAFFCLHITLYIKFQGKIFPFCPPPAVLVSITPFTLPP